MHDNERRDGSTLTIGNRERAMSAFVNRVPWPPVTARRTSRTSAVTSGRRPATSTPWFGKKDRCYLTVFAAFGNHVITQAERAYGGAPGSWETRLRLALEAAFGELTARPKMVRFLGQSSQVDGSRAVLLSLIERSRPLYFPEEVRQEVDDVPREPLEIIVSGSILHPIVMYIREEACRTSPS